jgi:hypothetical protein
MHYKMETFIVVDPDLNITNIYSCSEPCNYPEPLVQIQVPNGKNPSVFSPFRNADGRISLVEDPVKVENWRQSRFRVLRDMRDTKLTKCDWTQTNDVQLTDEKKESWRLYRQALRDLPSITQDPDNPSWPIPPQ